MDRKHRAARTRRRTLPRCGAPVDQLARVALYVQDCVFDHRAELRLHTPRIRSNCVSTTTAPADPQSSSPWLSGLYRCRGRRSTEPHVSCSARGLGLVEAFVLSKRRVTFGRACTKPRDSRRSRVPRRGDLAECVHPGGAHTPRASQESNSRAGDPRAFGGAQDPGRPDVTCRPRSSCSYRCAPPRRLAIGKPGSSARRAF